MHFLANENFPLLSIRLLREMNYDISSIIENSPGIPDSEVLSRAATENQIILTFDRDYALETTNSKRRNLFTIST